MVIEVDVANPGERESINWWRVGSQTAAAAERYP